MRRTRKKPECIEALTFTSRSTRKDPPMSVTARQKVATESKNAPQEDSGTKKSAPPQLKLECLERQKHKDEKKAAERAAQKLSRARQRKGFAVLQEVKHAFFSLYMRTLISLFYRVSEIILTPFRTLL